MGNSLQSTLFASALLLSACDNTVDQTDETPAEDPACDELSLIVTEGSVDIQGPDGNTSLSYPIGTRSMSMEFCDRIDLVLNAPDGVEVTILPGEKGDGTIGVDLPGLPMCISDSFVRIALPEGETEMTVTADCE